MPEAAGPHCEQSGRIQTAEANMCDIRKAALLAFAALSLANAPAIAGGWGNECGVCQPRYYASGPTYYAQPTYTYATPTITLVPHVIVQPNYIVQRTYVVRQDHYVADLPSCWFGCEPHRVVNQGQYPSPGPAPEYFVSPPAGFHTGYRSGFYRPWAGARYEYHYRHRTGLHY